MNPSTGPHATSELADAVQALLMHDPALAVVESNDGTKGIALILDGWYTDAAVEWGIGAEHVIEFWAGILNEIRDALARDKATT